MVIAPGHELLEHLHRSNVLDVYDAWSAERARRRTCGESASFCGTANGETPFGDESYEYSRGCASGFAKVRPRGCCAKPHGARAAGKNSNRAGRWISVY
jgi:hypothetical protein